MSESRSSPKSLIRIELVIMGVLLSLGGQAFPQDGIWISKTPMPTARCCLAVGVLNENLYAVGGQLPSGGPNVVLGTAEVYNPKTSTWTTKAPMPTPRYLLGAAVLAGTLYVVGGLDSTNFVTDVVEAYDPKTNTWAVRASLPTPRAGLSVAVVDGILYAIGGVEIGFNNTNFNVVEAYDPNSNVWVTRTPMPTARCCMAVGVISGFIYVAGGTRSIGHGGTETPGALEVYNPRTDTWSTKASMPTGRGGVAGAVVDGLFYVAGGILAPLNTELIQSTVEVYNPNTDTWSAQDSMPTRRWSPGAGVVEDSFYVIGGINLNSVVVNVNEAFSPFLPVPIDIKPGDAANTINLKARGTVQAAILSSATFDASTVNPDTVELAGAGVSTIGRGTPWTSFRDVDRDGRLDLVVQFPIADLGLEADDDEAVLKATTFSGQRIRGVDSIRLVP